MNSNYLVTPVRLSLLHRYRQQYRQHLVLFRLNWLLCQSRKQGKHERLDSISPLEALSLLGEHI
jgi:hypothetical protein